MSPSFACETSPRASPTPIQSSQFLIQGRTEHEYNPESCPQRAPGPRPSACRVDLGRVMAMLTGCLLARCSLGLIAAGGYLLNAATSNGGWLALGHGTYQTNSYAVASDPADWSTATWLLGAVDKVRIRVTPSDPATPVFVGMARPADVQRNLGGVQHVTAQGSRGYRVTYIQHDGQAPATPPATPSLGPRRPAGAASRRWSSTPSSSAAIRSWSS